MLFERWYCCCCWSGRLRLRTDEVRPEMSGLFGKTRGWEGNRGGWVQQLAGIVVGWNPDEKNESGGF